MATRHQVAPRILSMLALVLLAANALCQSTLKPGTPTLIPQTLPAGLDSLAFSPDGRWLATGNEHGVLSLREATTGRLVREFSLPAPVPVTEHLPESTLTRSMYGGTQQAIAFSPDGKFVATVSKSNRRTFNDGSWLNAAPAVWHVATGEPAISGEWTVGADKIASNPTSPWLPGEVIAWQFATDDAVARQFARYIGPALTISANGKVGARFTNPNWPREQTSIEILDVPSNRSTMILPGNFPDASNLALSPDGMLIAITYKGYGFEVWDTTAGQKVAKLDEKSWGVSAMTFSPDGKLLATAGDDATLHLWDVGTWKELLVQHYGGAYNIQEIVFSADSRLLACSSTELHVVDVVIRKQLYELAHRTLDGVTALAASPDNKRIAVARVSQPDSSYRAEDEAYLEFWPLSGGEPRAPEGRWREIDRIVFSADSAKMVASGRLETTASRYMHILVGSLVLWDVVGDHEVATPEFSYTSDAFGPDVFLTADGKQVVTEMLTDITPPRGCPYVQCGENEYQSYRRSIVILDFNTRELVKEFRAGRGNEIALAVSPDGKHAISANEKTLRLWDLEHKRMLSGFAPHIELPDVSRDDPLSCQPHSNYYGVPVVNTIGYAPDGKSIATGNDAGNIVFWDAARGTKLRETKAQGGVRDLRFSSDGKWLLSTDCLGKVTLLDAGTLTPRSLDNANEYVQASTWSADNSLVVGGTEAGGMIVWDAASGALLARVWRDSAGDWLVVTPDGLFDSSAKGMYMAAWRTENRLTGIDELPASFRSPGLLAQIFAGKRPIVNEDLPKALSARQ